MASSGAQFVLSFTLLHLLSTRAFGEFAFLLTATQFTWGLSGALLCSPLPLAYHSEEPERSRSLGAMFCVSALGAAAMGLLFAGIAVAMIGERLAGLLFGLYAGLALLRWFARADAYARGAPMRTWASDVVQAAIILGGTLLMFQRPDQALTIAAAALVIATIAGLVPFGGAFWRQQVLNLSPRQLPAFTGPWRDHGRWALLGVVTTEATANAHVYLVTLLLGPTKFAPIAASALIIRPINVAMNALTDFERPRLVREIAAGHSLKAQASLRAFLWLLAGVWLVSALATLGFFTFAPRLLVPAHQAVEPIMLGATLWLAVAAVRASRIPASALLQATGNFQSLAYASVWSAGFSVLLVLALLFLAGPMWSILGVLAGEIVFAAAILQRKRRWAAAQSQ